MSIDNPTYDDLLTVANNLKAEGQTSRALLVFNAAANVYKMQAVIEAARKLYHADTNEKDSAAWKELGAAFREYDI